MIDFTRYEKARIIGARALQISMGAPLLTDRGDTMSPIVIAKKEFDENVLPIAIRRINPEKKVLIKKEIPKTEGEGEENKDSEDSS